MPGPRVNFKIMAKNPNARGGCLCSPSSPVADCVGPYAVATGAEMLDVRRPYAVIGAGCALALAKKIDPDAFKKPKPVADPAAEARAAEVERVLDEVRGLVGDADLREAL